MTHEQKENYDFNFDLVGLSREEKIIQLKERYDKLSNDIEITKQMIETIEKYLQTLYYEKSA